MIMFHRTHPPRRSARSHFILNARCLELLLTISLNNLRLLFSVQKFVPYSSMFDSSLFHSSPRPLVSLPHPPPFSPSLLFLLSRSFPRFQISLISISTPPTRNNMFSSSFPQRRVGFNRQLGRPSDLSTFQQQLLTDPFSTMSLTPSVFGGRMSVDPFSEMDNMMSQMQSQMMGMNDMMSQLQGMNQPFGSSPIGLLGGGGLGDVFENVAGRICSPLLDAQRELARLVPDDLCLFPRFAMCH